MRILILVSKLNGGGAERVASLWANGFVSRNHKVAIAICAKDRHNEYPLDDSVIVYNIGKYKLARYLFYRNVFFGAYCYRKVINQFQPDVIIAVLPPNAYYAKKALLGRHIPIINTEHNAFEKPPYLPINKNDSNHKFKWNKLYNHVTVITQADKDYIADRLRNVSVLPNPLAYTPLNTIPKKKKTILAAGRFEVWHCKGFDILIKAWAKIASKYPEWELKIVGAVASEKESFSYLSNLISKHHIDSQVQLLSFSENIDKMYRESSIFVLSSRYEGFGMVLIEAMSQGCACIACDYKGRQSEIITRPEEGIICPVDDVDSLSLAIDKMISDDAYRKDVQYNSLKRAEYYSLENTMNRWDNILNSVVYKSPSE